MKSKLNEKIDSAIRFFLYVIIFWIPYSNAAIECSVVIAFLLWFLKRSIVFVSLCKDRRGSIAFEDLRMDFRPKITFLDKPIGLFLFACLLSVAGSMFFLESLRGFITKTLEWFVIFYLVQEVFTEKKHFKVALYVFLVTSVATVFDSFWQVYFSGKDIFNGKSLVDGRASAGFAHANSLASYLSICIVFLLSFAVNKSNSKIVRLFMFVAWFLFVWSLVITFSRSGWIAVVFGIFLLVFFHRKRLAAVFLIIAILTGAMFFVYGSQRLDIASRFSKDKMVYMAKWRVDIWEDSLDMIKERPIVGHGTNSYMKLFRKYRKKLYGRYEYSPTYAHNCYVQMTAEIGLLGLASFLWLIYVLLKESFKKARGNLIVLGGTVGICAFLVHSFFDTQFYSLQLSAWLWVSIGLVVAYSNTLLDSKVYKKGIINGKT